MLKLHPNCEGCDVDLPSTSADARICSYECTFCASCVEQLLKNVCPNCGGGFVPRPIRPGMARRPGVSIAQQPASTLRVHTKYTEAEIREFAGHAEKVPPSDR